MKERYQSKIAVYLVLTRLTNQGKEILFQRRYNTGYMDGKYEISCSGHLEKGESLSMAMVREAKEELGIEIQEKDLQLVFVNHSYKEDYMQIYFTTQKYKGSPQIIEKNKCDDLRWFNINNLPDNIMDRIEQAIKCMESGVRYDSYHDGDALNV